MFFIAFLSGSIPYSVWITRLFFKKDVRQFGDGNPGAFNVFLTGSSVLGLLVLILDVSKAAIPVSLAYQQLEVRGLPMLLIAIAPVLGHAFSPFLKFKGGKAISTVLGTLIGVSLWKLSLPGVIGAVLGYAFFTTTGWAMVVAIIFAFSAGWIWFHDPFFFWVLLSVFLILIWTLRTDFKKPPQLRPWVIKLFSRLSSHR
ncbi:MAG TPA: glycerol-3-phosphate acyltransferase [Anaerolineales bacterium]|nr:glycerol-3-phosphate acyltransferase [Anaerolineales bacterium]